MFSLLNCILVSSVKFLYGDLHSGGYKICIASYMSENTAFAGPKPAMRKCGGLC
jgi:hypothetical protein